MQTLLIVAAAAAMVALPARAALRTGRRGRIPFALAAAGTTLLALLLLDRWADSLLAAHMLQHVLIGDAVPLLLVLSVRGASVAELLPSWAAAAAARVGLPRAVAAATRPFPAFAVWSLSLAIWHVPSVYDRALADERLHALEHGSFAVAGVLVWSVLLDPAARRLLVGWQRFGYALALLAAGGALANVLVLSYRPLYPAYAVPAARPLALSPLQDQDLAALAMTLEQLTTVGAFAVLVAGRELRRAPVVRPAARHPLAS